MLQSKTTKFTIKRCWWLLDVYERNYEIYDKKLLAVIWGLEEYRHYLEEHPYKVEIWSDHQNLTFFRTAQKLTRRQAR